MPIYCYRAEDGEIYELDFNIGEAPSRIATPEGELVRDYQAEGVTGSVIGTDNPVKIRPRRPWPMACYASGVHASQAGELRRHLAAHGCPTEVTKDGDPVYTSAAHRKRALKIRGFFDKASYC